MNLGRIPLWLICVGSLSTGCSESEWVCPNGVLPYGIAIRDDEVFYSDLNRNGPLGTIDDTPVSACTEIPGGVYLEGQIRHLRLFDNVVRLGRVGNAFGSRISDVESEFFAELEVVSGDLMVPRPIVVGMNKLRYVGGVMGLEAPPNSLMALEEIGGPTRSSWLVEGALPKLRRIRGDYEIHITAREGVATMLPALEEVGGELDVTSHIPVTLPALRHVGEALNIGGNATFTSRVAFPELVDVGERLAVVNNHEMTDLHLPKVEAVGGELRIAGNDALASLAGLPSLRTVRGDVVILENPVLSSDEVDALVEQLDTYGALEECGNQEQAPCEWQ